jgi:DNA-binding response OmpR family regulator
MLFSRAHISGKLALANGKGRIPMSKERRFNVLIVEDEFFIAEELAMRVGDAGFSVLGPVPSLAQAKNLAERQAIDLALLDLNLNGESTLELALWLSERGSLVTIITGYDRTEVPEPLQDFPIFQKPLRPAALLDIVGDAQARCGFGEAVEATASPSTSIGHQSAPRSQG